MAADPYDLQRFVAAQAPVIDAVRGELRRGFKTSHWMWFVFPQLAALGASAMAKRYGIESVAEARAYLAHPVLGPRLLECCGLLLQLPNDDIEDILGHPDDLKLRSCLTLFMAASPGQPVLRQCLDKFYGGEPDQRTVVLCWKSDGT
jgi:uncharacterized protein (DUF1810 family)